MNGGPARLEEGEEETPTRERGGSCLVSAEVVRARDRGIGCLLFKVSVCKWALITEPWELEDKRRYCPQTSKLKRPTGGVPCLQDNGVAQFSSVGARASAPRASPAAVAGLPEPQSCGYSQVTAWGEGSGPSAARLFPRTGDHRVGWEDE